METTTNYTAPVDRPTPITDAFFSTFQDGLAAPSHDEYYHRLCDLERQLAEARDEIARLNKALSNASAIYDAAKEQRDKLAEALDGLIPTNARPMECDSPQLKAARAVLVAMKGGSP